MKILAIILLIVATVVAGMEIYTRLPVVMPQRTAAPELPADARIIVIVAHGSVDGDNPLFPEIVTRIRDQFAASGRKDVAVHFLHWAPWSDQRLRAVATAEQLGIRLGQHLARHAPLEELQIVTHSSGAYVADALCDSYRRNIPAEARPARVKMVFLDPFQLHGFVDWRHGARNHGHCADFAVAIINTDDVAPATNAPLANAWNIDVTAQPGRATFPRNGHYWPLQYYLDVLPGLASEPLEDSHQRYPRGVLVQPPAAMPATGFSGLSSRRPPHPGGVADRRNSPG